MKCGTDILEHTLHDVLVVGDSCKELVTEVARIELLTEGVQGPPGPPGPQGLPGSGGGTQYIEMLAGESIGGHRAVYARDGSVFHASSNDNANAGAVIGITLGATTIGSTAYVFTTGSIEESSWHWLPSKPIFLGLNGVLTQTPPSTGVSIVIGVPTASNSMSINVQMPINL